MCLVSPNLQKQTQAKLAALGERTKRQKEPTRQTNAKTMYNLINNQVRDLRRGFGDLFFVIESSLFHGLGWGAGALNTLGDYIIEKAHT